LTAVFAIAGVAGAFRLIHFAQASSQDFQVYWNAVRAWLAGRPPYAYNPQDLGFVFKYPPWMLPLFAPFGFIPWEASKTIWILAQIAIIGYSVRWLIRNRVQWQVAIGTAFLFWWIWLAHASAGQFTMALLFTALWAFPFESPNRTSVLALIFSSKIFSLITLGGLWRQYLRPRVWLSIVGFLLVAHAIIFALSPHETFLSLYSGWFRAATSGGAELGAEVVRGQGNHGFTAGILRWSGVDSRSFNWDIGTSLVLGVLFGGIWTRFSRLLSSAERWAGWLALGVIVHPLAWHHSFVLAFPLCAFAWDRAIKTGDRRLIATGFFGIAFIGLLIPQTIGHEWVRPLELVSVKSWGVVLSSLTLVLARMRVRTEPEKQFDAKVEHIT